MELSKGLPRGAGGGLQDACVDEKVEAAQQGDVRYFHCRQPGATLERHLQLRDVHSEETVSKTVRRCMER